MGFIKKKSKVCIVVDHVLQHYRVPLFKLLVEKGYDLTICYPAHFKRPSPKIEELDLDLAKRLSGKPHKVKSFLGIYYFGIGNLNKYDVVIFMQDLRVLDFWIATLNPFKKYSLFHWGIGISSFEGNNWINSRIRNFLAKFADSLILYSEKSMEYYSKKIKERIVIAHNTVENPLSENLASSGKDSFLFIGRLEQRKGLTELLRAFSVYLDNSHSLDIQKLVIIGEGEMEATLMKLAKDLQIKKNVTFVGSIKSDALKKEYFKKAQLCISMKQAGLSVLEAFSYGIPFVTMKNATTGGERFNIIHNKTGFLVDSEADLTDLLHYAQKNPELISEVGSNAYRLYTEERTMEKMGRVFEQEIDRVLMKKCPGCL